MQTAWLTLHFIKYTVGQEEPLPKLRNLKKQVHSNRIVVEPVQRFIRCEIVTHHTETQIIELQQI